MQVDIRPLGINFKSTGAMDNIYFWINGASQFIPNMVKLIERSSTLKVVDMSDMNTAESDTLKDLFDKYGSDKHFHKYNILYSQVMDPSKEMSIMEIGLGSRDPSMPSSMYYYQQDKNFINTTGGCLRSFRDFCPLAKLYGADIDKKILFNEERIETFHVDQLDTSSLKNLFEGRMFDIIIDDGLHHISSNMNTLIESLDHVNIGGYILIEDIIIVDNWHVVDFAVSKIPGFETKLVHFGTGSYIYCVKRVF
jgi:hypothetical protein